MDTNNFCFQNSESNNSNEYNMNNQYVTISSVSVGNSVADDVHSQKSLRQQITCIYYRGEDE